MKKQSFKQLFILVALALATLSMTSCNRGYGCPTWSMQKTAVKAAQTGVSVLLGLPK
ncbi:MAG: hypothetical protein KDC44_15940 [Phaeodactylibacter sp.]|nr:hypothetical protein [Phaeodactylibacter sp.]